MEFYRFDYHEYAEHDEDGEYCSPKFPKPILELSTYILSKETEKGYWIKIKNWDTHLFQKWVSKTSRKRFAYPTKEEALESFIKRTKRRIRIIKWQIQCCELSLEQANSWKLKL